MRSIDLTFANWRKSSYSNPDGGACVEVADDLDSVIPVRDSKVLHGPVLMFPMAGWSAFVEAVRGGELNA
ncbi:DUF397 domain-containing protein [Streptomyces iconiensis]|uniref:DUF397 domain-containing protein n=1 Tax=Streptomyces iconiensis TaxID=1384038 RepID=A0ABT6ZP17_9ACTN|nr:DUF397 domain-containing protein [Streptomyces iconiensis]MDJ1130791.1 DUF397 domain-containing protein [Streptomyces iconiensis]